MALYGVQRMEKYKAKDIAGLQGEAQRTAKNYINEVDPERIKNDIFLCRTDDWTMRISEILEDKNVRVRKDSNLLVGGLYTATKEFFYPRGGEGSREAQERAERYFKDCLDWHIKKYCGGNPDLILSAVIHMDETTPHLQVYSVPLVQRANGRYGNYALSAKKILGTNRDYASRVTEFWQTVTKKYGLERGEPSRDGEERKKHVTAQQHKAQQARQEERKAKAGLEATKQQQDAAEGFLSLIYAETQQAKAERERTEETNRKRQAEEERHIGSLKAIGETLLRGNNATLEESKRINAEYLDIYTDAVFVETASVMQEWYAECWADAEAEAEARLQEKGILSLEEFKNVHMDEWETEL